MLCSRCRTHIFSSSSRFLLTQSRPYSRTPSFLSSDPVSPAPAPTPTNPSINLPSTNSSSPGTSSSSGPPGKMQSSCIVGTPLRGLNYTKNGPNLVAMDDSEYPSWLWKLVDDGGKGGMAGGDDAEEVQMNRKQRKRHEKKMAAIEAAKPREILIHEQAIDIISSSETANAGDDLVNVAVEGQEKRAEVTKSAREARRKGIREANYLKGL